MRRINFLLLLAAMLALFSCNDTNQTNNPPLSEEDKIVNELMAKCQNFDTTTFAQELPGIWDTDTSVIYDEKWLEIINWNMVMGKYNNEVNGWSSIKYVFHAGGEGLYHIFDCNPNTSTNPKAFDWYYNSENGELMISGENFTLRRTVSGFNNEFLVLDYKGTGKHNIREIYKRKAE